MNDLMQAGLKCQENKFANKNSMAQEKQTNKLDMSKNKVMAPKPGPVHNDEDVEFEIDFGASNGQGTDFKSKLL